MNFRESPQESLKHPDFVGPCYFQVTFWITEQPGWSSPDTGRVLWPVQGPKNAKRSKSTLPVIKAWKKHLFIYCVYHIVHMSQKKNI
jgi:cytochrome bd-type quinol oxidase subunit 1